MNKQEAIEEIKNQTGERYVCRKDIFEKTYKEVEE